MAIVASDLHCNLDKVKMFLEYKPEEELYMFNTTTSSIERINI